MSRMDAPQRFGQENGPTSPMEDAVELINLGYYYIDSSNLGSYFGTASCNTDSSCLLFSPILGMLVCGWLSVPPSSDPP